jgi:hypothetical protein
MIEETFRYLAKNKSAFESLDEEQTIKKADELIAYYIEKKYLVNNFFDYVNKEYKTFIGEFGEGGEAKAYLAENANGDWVAVKHGLVWDGLFYTLVNKIVMQNALFKDVPYILKGFTKNNNNIYEFILEQPYVRTKKDNKGNDIIVPRTAVKEDMNSRHFENKGHIFVDKNYIIEDLHGKELSKAKNVLTDEKGILRYIDPMIRLNTEKDDYGGKRSYREFLGLKDDKRYKIIKSVEKGKEYKELRETNWDYINKVADEAIEFQKTVSKRLVTLEEAKIQAKAVS